MAKNLIACRVQSYAPFEHLAYAHLAALGIRYVEIHAPPPEQVAAVCDGLRSHGLSASSLHGECDVSRDDVAEQVAQQMPAFAALGTKLLFVSVKAAGTPLTTVYERLRRAGDVACRQGVTLALETHPDLVTNAATARRTMEGVAHPFVRVNYDTANIYYYNRDVDGVSELRQIADFVAAVHLKDTDGGYQHWRFPALGRGVVRFAEVFHVLDSVGFAGPCTLEIEGIEGEERTERLVLDRIAESAGYLRGLGRL
jgi:L-ribulose-5-phosphate 3-epimerase